MSLDMSTDAARCDKQTINTLQGVGDVSIYCTQDGKPGPRFHVMLLCYVYAQIICQ